MRKALEKADDIITRVMRLGIAGLKPDEFKIKLEFIEWADSGAGSDRSTTIVCDDE